MTLNASATYRDPSQSVMPLPALVPDIGADEHVGSGKSREEIAEAYDSPPWWYDVRGFFILTFAYNNTLGSQLRFFGRNFGRKHLDVACGTGTLLQLTILWRKLRGLPAAHTVGVDYADSMLAGARRRFARNSAIELHRADAAELPFASDTFDTANVANAVHCFPDVDGALRDIHRVLKPGGTLAANVLLYPRGFWPLRWIAERIDRWGMRKGILYTPYRHEEILARIVRAGFELVEQRVAGNCCNILARKPHGYRPS